MTHTPVRWSRRRLLDPVTLIGVGIAVLLALAVPAHAAPAPHPATSPQDGRIYFTDDTGRIVSTTSTGSDRKSLKGGIYTDPAVSPDGTRIAFAFGTGGGIGLENVDGSGRRTLVPDSGGRPSWSPDGTKIVFDTDGDIAVVTVATGAVTYLSHDADTTEEVAPAWSPNGRWIAFTVRGCDDGARCVYRMNAANGRKRINLTPASDTSDNADWTPTNAIDYSSGGGCNPLGGSNIFSMAASGADQHVLTCTDPNSDNDDTYPTVSPSGQHIAFLSDAREDTSRDQLYVANADGSAITYIDTDSPFGIAGPDWAVAPAPQTTTLTLSASPTTVASGKAVTLSGALTPASGQGYGGQKIVVMAEPEGSSTYSPVRTVQTAQDGTWTTKLKPSTTTSYEATYAANPTMNFGGSTSPAQAVTVD